MSKTIVNATYRNLLTKTNVLVNIPGKNDKHMKFIGKHEIVVEGKTIPVPSHFRRGDIINGNFVTRNFFFNGNLIDEKSQKVVATVTVVEKTDHSRGDKKSLILDIHPKVNCYDMDRVETILTIGATEGDVSIPETDKFIAFRPKK
jgi:hypothetical protein